MSMILDALARAEREREKNDAVSTTPVGFDSTAYEKKQKFAIWVVGALLVNALVISAVLVAKPWASREDTKNAVAEQAPASTVDSAPSPLTKNSKDSSSGSSIEISARTLDRDSVSALKSEARVAEPQTAAETENPQNVTDLSKQAAIASSGVKPIIKPKIEKNPQVRYATAPIISASKKQQPVAAEAIVNTDYKRLEELSGTIKSQLNEYEVNVHVYDKNPNRSFVLINMTRLKNGDQIPGGPTVERIVPEGVIVQYQGERVLIERN